MYLCIYIYVCVQFTTRLLIPLLGFGVQGLNVLPRNQDEEDFNDEDFNDDYTDEDDEEENGEGGAQFLGGGGRDGQAPEPAVQVLTPYTLKPAPCTLHPTPSALHPKPYTLHYTPCT
jgi:hypothetical protein